MIDTPPAWALVHDATVTKGGAASVSFVLATHRRRTTQAQAGKAWQSIVIVKTKKARHRGDGTCT